ncbi:IS66 family insertion sequence element accessory protein TnpB [Geomicrobium halophilum]|uniref:IS66 family insertion sequence element accessory protein TnpB n=1 Tax=Geomicrobium halophilum TaxID=549000 RepID=UPI003CCCA2EC
MRCCRKRNQPMVDFSSRRGNHVFWDKLKTLQWEHNGFWLHYRRLGKGSFIGHLKMKQYP